MNQISAEAAGIFAGDGTLYKTNWGFVLEVRGSMEEEYYYQKFVSKIFSKVFNEEINVFDRNCKVMMKCVRKTGLDTYNIFHETFGFPIGRKENIVKVPEFVLNSDKKEIWISYLRGVFDTDGCVSLTKNRKKWMKPIVDFASVSINHRIGISVLLKRLGFNCHFQGCKVRIGGWSTVKRFFKIIKPHNNLKTNKWNEILVGKLESPNLVWHRNL